MGNGGIVRPPEVEEEVRRRGYTVREAHAPAEPHIPPDKPPTVIEFPAVEHVPVKHEPPPGVHAPPVDEALPGVHIPAPLPSVRRLPGYPEPPELPGVEEAVPESGLRRWREWIAVGLYAVVVMTTKDRDIMIPPF